MIWIRVGIHRKTGHSGLAGCLTTNTTYVSRPRVQMAVGGKMKLLYNWTLSGGVDGIALAQNFNLYVADYDNNKIFGYRPGIGQCT